MISHTYRAILICLALSAVGSALSQTMVVPALPAIQNETQATAGTLVWVITAFLLIGAVSTPLATKLGRIYGNRLLTVVLTAACGLGSAMAGYGVMKGNIEIVVCGRALQGLSAGVVPLSFAIVREHAPPPRVGMGVVLLSSMLALGGALGLPLGGVIVDSGGVAWIFAFSVVTSAASIIALLLVVPESTRVSGGRIDVPGAILLALGLGALLMGMSNGQIWGWPVAGVLGLSGVAIMFGFVVFERRRAEPLVDISLLAGLALRRTNIATFLIGYGVFGSFFLLPLLLQVPAGEGGLGFSATQAGLMAMPVAVVNFAVSPLLAILARKRGPRFPVILGCVVGAITMALIALAPASLSLLLIASVLWGIAFSAGMAAISNLVVQLVEPEQTGETTGINIIIRNVGSALGSQVGGALVTIFAVWGLVQVQALAVTFVLSGLACIAGAIVAARIPFEAVVPTPDVQSGTPVATPASQLSGSRNFTESPGADR